MYSKFLKAYFESAGVTNGTDGRYFVIFNKHGVLLGFNRNFDE
ncbi:MAG: hypothetical protein NZT61_02275 [Deltaproteobacteria bacterium]|nr:hypothetical protein [Deltaproteobacteria bacterium]